MISNKFLGIIYLVKAYQNMLTEGNKCSNMLRGTDVLKEKYIGRFIMTENEYELLNIIRNHNNPEQALDVALQIILAFLEQLESFQGRDSVCPRESA